jgi:flavin reductase (DIM6/NTAB) family NADH-FMN oxidoreductase RutF/catechol 2,3-dioxygenase-like lactoylglutathione lyase family enzyme
VDKRSWHPSPLPGQVVLVTTVDADGEPNVAPKSWVSMVAFGPPPVLMFGCNKQHGTARNAVAAREFVINIPGSDLVGTCWAIGVDQDTPRAERLSRYGLSPLPAKRVKPPLVAECRAHLECRLEDTREFGDELILFGRIVAVSMDTRATEGSEHMRYRALEPFFFLESGWAAPMGGAHRAGQKVATPEPVLTIFAVRDLGRAVRFYDRAFGWPKRVETPVFVEFELPDGRGLGLYNRETFAANTGRIPHPLPHGALNGTELYFRCELIEEAMANLEAAGARVLSPLSPRAWGDEAVYYADGDGNVLVLARPAGDDVA